NIYLFSGKSIDRAIYDDHGNLRGKGTGQFDVGKLLYLGADIFRSVDNLLFTLNGENITNHDKAKEVIPNYYWVNDSLLGWSGKLIYRKDTHAFWLYCQPSDHAKAIEQITVADRNDSTTT